ncbi:hypothetical protein ACFPOB_01015 [Bosea eneae]|uniref:Resolvase HTH domain-containing protein n=1 Tax=Bosea eneae TaxID=151454 RepID=A0ABW0IIN1_9HYPH
MAAYAQRGGVRERQLQVRHDAAERGLEVTRPLDVLTVPRGPAEFERELIKAPTGEGRSLAKARGQPMGRPGALTRHQPDEALQALDAGTATQAVLARRFDVTQATISRLARTAAA